MRKILWIVLCLLICLSIPIAYKVWPVMRNEECYRTFFPKSQFLAKLAQPIPEWMQAQIQADLKPFERITQESLDVTFDHIAKHAPVSFERYRIVRGKLYKYAPKGKLSSRDTPFEKALKTLLLYAKMDDVDFIYCPMDGLPEPYVSKDIYLSSCQAPIFAKARLTSAPFIVLIPDPFSLSEVWQGVSQEILALNEEISWEEKKPIAIWRGGLTDIGMPNGSFVSHFRECPRYKICTFSEEWVDAGLQWSDCEALDAILKEEGVLKGHVSKKEHLLCKYQPVLDGHMCTYPGYQWRLLSNSVCLKQESDQEQWFYSALKPYVHFIPIKNDLSDLQDKIQWARDAESEVRNIVASAQKFAKQNLLLEDDYVYLYWTLKEYASRQKIDRKMQGWECIHYRKRNDLFKSIRKKLLLKM